MWEDLYEAHYSELVQYGARMSGSRELAEDLAQETFIRAMASAGLLEDFTPSKRRAWLYRTFKNLFFDRCRRTSLENQYIQHIQTVSAEEPGIQEVENAMLLQSITAKDRMILELRYREGYTAKEISEMLHIPAGTVRSRLARCRQKLQEELEF